MFKYILDPKVLKCWESTQKTGSRYRSVPNLNNSNDRGRNKMPGGSRRTTVVRVGCIK